MSYFSVFWGGLAVGRGWAGWEWVWLIAGWGWRSVRLIARWAGWRSVQLIAGCAGWNLVVNCRVGVGWVEVGLVNDWADGGLD